MVLNEGSWTYGSRPTIPTNDIAEQNPISGNVIQMLRLQRIYFHPPDLVGAALVALAGITEFTPANDLEQKVEP